VVIGEPKVILDKTLLQTIQPPARLKIKANTQAAIEKKMMGSPKKKSATPRKRAEFEILINTISRKRTLKLLGNKENQVSEIMNNDLADISISFQKQRRP
jgi:hypothetical protein